MEPLKTTQKETNINAAQEETTIGQRSMSADILKAISIVGVVFIHGAFLIPFSPSYLDGVSALFRFCVPVFIILWAYFAEKSILKHNNPYPYLFTRFYRLLIPFAFWSTVYLVITANVFSLSFAKIITKHWSGYGWSGQYYFIILFQLIPLFVLIRRISHRFINIPGTVIILSILFYGIVSYSPLFTINIVNKLGHRPFIYWLPYVFIGILYANRSTIKQVSVPLLVGTLAPILIPLEFFVFYPHVRTSSPYLSPGVFIAASLLWAAVMSQTGNSILSKLWLSNLVTILGRNTLGIFCLNPLVIIALSPITNYSNSYLQFWGCSVFMPLFSTALIITICLGIIFLLKRVKLGMLVVS
ncbi:acyltransferase family protein [Spirosoma areae]